SSPTRSRRACRRTRGGLCRDLSTIPTPTYLMRLAAPPVLAAAAIPTPESLWGRLCAPTAMPEEGAAGPKPGERLVPWRSPGSFAPVRCNFRPATLHWLRWRVVDEQDLNKRSG